MVPLGGHIRVVSLQKEGGGSNHPRLEQQDVFMGRGGQAYGIETISRRSQSCGKAISKKEGVELGGNGLIQYHRDWGAESQGRGGNWQSKSVLGGPWGKRKK